MSQQEINKDIFTKLSIENYKSIKKLSLPLTNINVFIGANGCGKSNILEAVALLAAQRGYSVKISDLQQIGVRITKPSLMKNSFLGKATKHKISVSLSKGSQLYSTSFNPKEDDIYTDWVDEENQLLLEKNLQEWAGDVNLTKEFFDKLVLSARYKEDGQIKLTDYLIYTLNTNALRGLSNESKLQPLGIYGEGLDVLLSTFTAAERAQLDSYIYKLVDWLDDIEIDQDDKYKHKGHKLGRSNSLLYFTDKFMQKQNNLFSAENSNEGVLHVLFYLALFISKRTPSFFAIDNIESCLNPQICRTLIKVLAALAKENNKQAIITTHNPAILDGLNLHDPAQALFVVKRTDEGDTKADKIMLKPQPEGERYKLSELWMRGHLGGLPNNF